MARKINHNALRAFVVYPCEAFLLTRGGHFHGFENGGNYWERNSLHCD